MSTSFGSISLAASEMMVDKPSNTFDEALYRRVLLNEIPYSFNNTANTMPTCAQDDSFISTSFNKPVYESENIQSNYLTNPLDTVDNNIVSTSFSTRIATTPISHIFNNKSETTSSTLRNVKSSKISDKLLTKILSDTDALATEQSSLLNNTCNNLMSTSFNYPETNAAAESSNIASFSNTFICSNDQAAKLQHSVMEEKETRVPPSSLTSSFATYLYGLPKKNYPLSRSTPGLTDLDESIHKLSPSSKPMHIASRILQKPNSMSNISQSQKTSFKSYKYGYDYVSFRGTRDNTDLQMTGRKFVPQNFHLSYSTQHKLLENRYLSRSIQNNSNVSANRETKLFSNVPPLPVINTSTANAKISTCPSFVDTPVSSNEKPKVKFSDTVTHILVPGTVSVHIVSSKTIMYIYCDSYIKLHT